MGERFELEKKLKDEIRARVFGDDFMKLVQTVRRNGKVFKIALRPVLIGDERKLQAEMTDDGHVQVKNLTPEAAESGLEEIIAQRGARELHIMTGSGDLHIRVTKKGHVLESRSAELSRKVVLQPHDRVKKTPLTSFDSTTLLGALGLTDGEGRVRASMRGKYDQVNEFLKVAGEAINAPTDKPLVIVACGCGKAYLTQALYHYLVYSRHYADVTVIGVDRREDVLASARRVSQELDTADRVLYAQSDLADFSPTQVTSPSGRTFTDKVDVVISLHACDTATDEALAKAVEWRARYILSAPCCQHELQKTLNDKGAFAGLMRQGILRERLCDILTDTFRALILRILGFRTQVVEFVSSDATARNIMIRAEYGVKPGQPGPVSEYLNLRDYWHVTPWLETRLATLLNRYFERYD